MFLYYMYQSNQTINRTEPFESNQQIEPIIRIESTNRTKKYLDGSRVHTATTALAISWTWRSPPLTCGSMAHHHMTKRIDRFDLLIRFE